MSSVPYTGQQGPEDRLASRIMTFKDYAVINRRTTEVGCVLGFGGGGLLSYGLHRFRPQISRNALFLTFFTTSTLLTFLSTHALLSRRVATVRSQLPSTGGDEDLDSWKVAQGKEFEAGVGGMEELRDRYATTRGDH